MREADRQLVERARRQFGVVTRAQAVECGLSPSGWLRRLHGGELVAVHPGVARYATVPPSDHQRALAAVLAAGRSAMASHTVGARLWGVPIDHWRPEVIVLDRNRSPRLPGVVVHRPVVLADLEPSRRRGIAVTSPLRLLVDLGRPGHTDDLELALDAFHTKGLVTMAAAHAVLRRHRRPGAIGPEALRQVLARWTLGHDLADSEFELVISALLAEHGLPDPSFHHRIGRYEVDLAFSEQRVAVEVDGWATHGRRRAFEADRARDLELAARGWLVVRLTWWAATTHPRRCMARLCAVLERRSVA